MQEAGDFCVWARDGERGLELARSQKFDAIVLDILLPPPDGLEVLRTLRGEGIQTPVVLLSGMLGSVDERVAGLEAGADDYLVKPFAFAELKARIEAVGRRALTRAAPVFQVEPLQLDLSTRRVTRSGKEIDLTPTEFSLLELLMRHAGQVVTRKMLCEHLWESDWEGSTSTSSRSTSRACAGSSTEASISPSFRRCGDAGMSFANLNAGFGTLRTRLTLWNTVVLLVLVALTLMSVREGLRRLLVDRLNEFLMEEMAEIQDDMRERAPKWTEIHTALNNKSRDHPQRRMFVQLFTPSGTLLWSSDQTPEEEWTGRLLGPSDQPVVLNDYRLLQRPLEGHTVVIRVGVSTQRAAHDLAELTTFMLFLGGVVLLITPVVGYLLAGRATHPLSKIIDTAARLHPAQLDERLPVRGTHDQLDQLSETINGLLDRIARYLEQNREFNAHAARAALPSPPSRVHSR